MKIAITGSIGSGKSSVGTYLRSLQYEVVDTDQIVHEFYHSDNILFKPVVDVFGIDILDETGEIDRGLLGAKVFNDSLALNDLESIVFPAVANYIQNYDDQNHDVYFEVPMLFESHMDVYFDLILMIDTDVNLALERLEKRGISKDNASKRLRLQMDPQLKIEKSHVLIHNNGSMADLFARVDAYLVEREVIQ